MITSPATNKQPTYANKAITTAAPQTGRHSQRGRKGKGMQENEKAPASGREQENLYCAMLFLACFVEDAKNDRIADFGIPCGICRIRKNIKCKFNFYERVKILSSNVGVKISPVISEKYYQVHQDK